MFVVLACTPFGRWRFYGFENKVKNRQKNSLFATIFFRFVSHAKHARAYANGMHECIHALFFIHIHVKNAHCHSLCGYDYGLFYVLRTNVLRRNGTSVLYVWLKFAYRSFRTSCSRFERNRRRLGCNRAVFVSHIIFYFDMDSELQRTNEIGFNPAQQHRLA